MPLAFATTLAKKLVDELAPYCQRIEIAGSVRRQSAEVGDIELVAIPKFAERPTVTQQNLFEPQTPTSLERFSVLDQKLDQMQVPISACLSKWRKIHPETVPVGAKACSNYLNGYLARRDANNRGFDVGLMLGTDGLVSEGATESFFMVKDGVLKTPPVGSILSSVSSMSVIASAEALGIPTSLAPILPDEMADADEIFTAHTGVKVHPVVRYEDRRLEVPGPVTTQLTAFFESLPVFKEE